MTINRRGFLGSLAAFGAVGTVRPTAAKDFRPTGALRLKAGIFSDLHITDEKHATVVVEKALRYFREAEVDAVICTGDVADNGLEKELELFEAAWNRVFPENRGRDGKVVERVFITGNHDLGQTGSNGKDTRLQQHRTFLGEPLVPVFMKTVKGYAFVCQNWFFGKEARAFIAAHATELKGEKPFFYLQHSHLRNTIPYAWVHDDGQTTEVLKAFPNCVALTGHSHWPIVDGRSLWQGEFTAVNCGCLRYTMVCGGRENARTFGVVDPLTSQMPAINRDTYNDGQDGMVMEVYDDAIVFRRRDFKYGLSLGDDWVVPWPISRGSASIETRAAATPAPAFAKDAKVVTERRMGQTRRGEKVEQLFVRFPNCRTMDGSPSRAYDFEVSLETREFDVVKPLVVKRVYSRGFYRGEEKDLATVECAFGLGELPTALTVKDGSKRPTIGYRFVVRPINTFGRKGEAIFSGWTEI